MKDDLCIHRVGIGTDLHRTAPGRPLILGGVTIESPFGLAGHSDADVVLHAVIDALLGAAGQPDIGELFPDTDPQWRGADSGALLKTVMGRIRDAGFAIVNVDLTIHAEKPKLSAYKEAIRDKLSGFLGIHCERIGVKAKTGEGLDAVGRGEAIGCTVIAALSMTAQ